jgi:choline-sulfatase
VRAAYLRHLLTLISTAAALGGLVFLCGRPPGFASPWVVMLAMINAGPKCLRSLRADGRIEAGRGDQAAPGDSMPSGPLRRPAACLVWLALAGVLAATACGRSRTTDRPPGGPASPRPSILLVTLDTTRADVVGPEAKGIHTPAFDALAARGLRFRQAYAAVPETLPSHVSMMTGLYPAGHAIHENGRTLAAAHALAAERLKRVGYRTAAFVSSFTLARRFGLARGFDVYDDVLAAGQVERTARETTDAALAYLAQSSQQPVFLWVHYFDPHYPYSPPEPFRTRFAGQPYLGEVAAMDSELGRLIAVFEQRAPGPTAFLVVGDHGEGLGEHGEALHGNLVYQSTMHVPLAIAGPGVSPGVEDAPVGTRHVFHTVLDWAGVAADGSLRRRPREVVLGEAMKPFLEYGWQPQIMSVDGTRKAILAGRLEIYDVAADPAETRDLSGDDQQRARVPAALRDYPVPAPAAARAPDTLDEQSKRSLAALGYVSASAAPVVRKGAPRPADMVGLFELLEKASGLFVAEEYTAAIPLLEKIRAADPFNLDAVLRLATAHSALGHDRQALEMFRKAAELSPASPDVRLYLALHYARGKDWPQAVPLLEQVVAEVPDRLPALEALAVVRERQGRVEDAIALRARVYALRAPTREELVRLGQLEMDAGLTPAAIEAFERARSLDPGRFAHDLELGVLYLDARRFGEARDALDRVKPSHPGYAMALFKRAQVSVLLDEPDRAARIAAARARADAETRPLIERERLFLGQGR